MLRRRQAGYCPFQGWGGGGDLVATKESNFQSPEHLNHSYQPGMSYRNAVRDTYTKTPRHAGGGGTKG